MCRVFELPRYRIEFYSDVRHMYGYCDIKLKNYIEINICHYRNNLNEIIVTLCHELIHAKQFIDGRLQSKNFNIFWNGYNYSTTEYLSRPWEIEAYEKQLDWYFQYLSRGNNDILFTLMSHPKWKRDFNGIKIYFEYKEKFDHCVIMIEDSRKQDHENFN